MIFSPIVAKKPYHPADRDAEKVPQHVPWKEMVKVVMVKTNKVGDFSVHL
jgi:hypothetical protein